MKELSLMIFIAMIIGALVYCVYPPYACMMQSLSDQLAGTRRQEQKI